MNDRVVVTGASRGIGLAVARRFAARGDQVWNLSRSVTLRDLTGVGRLIEPDEIAGILELAAHNPVLNGAVLHSNYGQRER